MTTASLIPVATMFTSSDFWIPTLTIIVVISTALLNWLKAQATAKQVQQLQMVSSSRLSQILEQTKRPFGEGHADAVDLSKRLDQLEESVAASKGMARD